MSMTYDERREARQARLDARREKMTAEGKQRYDAAIERLRRYPMGQPVLVGHHSERRHRRDLARVDADMGKAAEAFRAAAAVPPEATSAILASDADALPKLREQLALHERWQARMVAANALVRADDRAGLAAMNFTPGEIEQLFRPDYMGRTGFSSFSLASNGANIRRIRSRIAELTAIKERPPVTRTLPLGVELEEDAEDMRLRLRFPAKPDEPLRAELKRCGFRWAPSTGAWQSHLNNRARWQAQRIERYLEDRTAIAASVPA
jgi:hypothetical protein